MKQLVSVGTPKAVLVSSSSSSPSSTLVVSGRDPDSDELDGSPSFDEVMTLSDSLSLSSYSSWLLPPTLDGRGGNSRCKGLAVGILPRRRTVESFRIAGLGGEEASLAEWREVAEGREGISTHESRACVSNGVYVLP